MASATGREAVAFKGGMPKLRFVFVPHPVGGQPPSKIRAYALGSHPRTEQSVLDEIVEALAKPLTLEDKAAPACRSVPRLVEPDTEELLHRLFREKGWTDGLPIVLPTARKVAEMLSARSHRPDEVVGRMWPIRRRSTGNTPWRRSLSTRSWQGPNPAFSR